MKQCTIYRCLSHEYEYLGLLLKVGASISQLLFIVNDSSFIALKESSSCGAYSHTQRGVLKYNHLAAAKHKPPQKTPQQKKSHMSHLKTIIMYEKMNKKTSKSHEKSL